VSPGRRVTMHKRIVGIAVLSLLFILSAAALVSAQEISTEKRELIDELMEVSQMKKQVDKMIDIMLLQMENNYGEMIRDVIPESDEISEECRGEVVESSRRFVRRFRELYPQRVNMGEVIDQIYYPLYDKYFTSNDLKYMIEFYKSTTGQKFISIMPDFMKESMQRSSEILNPIMIDMVNEIMQEEKERLKGCDQD
jgi:hypothetical protein